MPSIERDSDERRQKMIDTNRSCCWSMDFSLLFLTRILRMFSYGAITVVFMIDLLYRFQILDGFTPDTSALYVNILLGGILVGEFFTSLWLTTNADRVGRQRTLLIGSALKVGAGLVFATSDRLGVLLLAGILGVISPNGGDVGPFVTVEQSCLTQILEDTMEDPSLRRIALTDTFAFYQLVGLISFATGSLASGAFVAAYSGSTISLFSDSTLMGEAAGLSLKVFLGRTDSMRPASVVFVFYAFCGLAKAFLYFFLSESVEPPKKSESDEWDVVGAEEIAALSNPFEREERRLEAERAHRKAQLHSRGVLRTLCVLFSIDAFAGGLALQSYMSWWFHERWAVSEASLGQTLFLVNIASGLSALGAGWFVKRFGEIPTMVFTHLPSNVLLVLVPLMPTQRSALMMLVARFSISQMDVPARHAYVSMNVTPEDSGWINAARSAGIAFAPLLLQLVGAETALPGSMAFNAPFYMSGLIKCVYDLMLWHVLSNAERDRSQMSTSPTSSPADLGSMGDRKALLQPSRKKGGYGATDCV
jgi:MFS family permease